MVTLQIKEGNCGYSIKGLGTTASLTAKYVTLPYSSYQIPTKFIIENKNLENNFIALE